MRYLDLSDDRLKMGMAYGPIVTEFAQRHPELVDYVEIPFEQLRHHPPTAQVQQEVPVILHCSSMSIAGFVPTTEATLDAIAVYAERTRTPWIGEHLAFISADSLDVEGNAPPVELTYTVCPQLSEETVERVAANLQRLRPRYDVPIILENSPQYFEVPGSTMSMPAFVAEVARRCDVDLLLDLTHFLITTSNLRLDPREAIREMPLERVVEVHLSGMSWQSGRWWDDHAAPVPDTVFELLDDIAPRLKPRAITFEYNWAPAMPESLLVEQMSRVRRLLALAA